jgi:hypothetical protein
MTPYTMCYLKLASGAEKKTLMGEPVKATYNLEFT